MNITKHKTKTELVPDERQIPKFFQVRFVVKLGISFEKVNRGENERTAFLPIALKPIEQLSTWT